MTNLRTHSYRNQFLYFATLQGLLFMCHSTAAIAQRRVQADWKLLKGSAEVCSAYVKMLNATQFTKYPYCDRTPISKSPNFAFAERTPLTPAEAGKLADPVLAFLSSDDRGNELGAQAVKPPAVTGGNADWLADKQRTAIESTDPLRYLFRFRPAFDIDNDGALDNVVVWKDPDIYCGGPQYANGTPVYSGTYLLFLSPDGQLDAKRTRAIFGHPKGQVLIFPDPQDPTKKVTRQKQGFRAIGTSFGVFRFKETTYFDTFYAPGGDLNGARDGDAGYESTLAVLRNRKGHTELVCELRASNTRDSVA